MTDYLPTEQLIQSVKVLSKKFDDDSMAAFDLALNILECRLPEDQFLALCDDLED